MDQQVFVFFLIPRYLEDIPRYRALEFICILATLISCSLYCSKTTQEGPGAIKKHFCLYSFYRYNKKYQLGMNTDFFYAKTIK